MVNKILFTSLLFMVGMSCLKAQGQFKGSNLLEYQLGNLPQLEPKDQSSLYDQLDLSYRIKSFGLFARVEQYYPSFKPAENYIRLSQFKFQYNSGLFDVNVGNFYSTLGRGLLLRTYEIPSSIWETRGYRVRYGFYRDMLGASAKLNLKNFELKLLRGEILDVTLPPTIDDLKLRRPDRVEGGEASYHFSRQKVGLTCLRYHPLQEPKSFDGSYFSTYYDGVILKNFSVYAELAKNLQKGNKVYSFAEDAAYGAYASVNYAVLNFGMSLEYKNYHNFLIGNGINDPPTLVKEHSYRLLNRSTHVPSLTDESGYQLEIYYNLPNGNLLTFNTSLAKNEITEARNPVFNEYFLEYQMLPSDKISAKLFGDYARDPFTNENKRYAAGGSADFQHKKLTSTVETEWQQIQRDSDGKGAFYNLYGSYTLTKASKYSGSLVVELTTDPIQLESDKTHNIYPSLNLTYRPDNKNIISLFVGKRRGGPACNSGVCYDVLDFQGAEIRVSTRF